VNARPARSNAAAEGCRGSPVVSSAGLLSSRSALAACRPLPAALVVSAPRRPRAPSSVSANPGSGALIATRSRSRQTAASGSTSVSAAASLRRAMPGHLGHRLIARRRTRFAAPPLPGARTQRKSLPGLDKRSDQRDGHLALFTARCLARTKRFHAWRARRVDLRALAHSLACGNNAATVPGARVRPRAAPTRGQKEGSASGRLRGGTVELWRAI
jgi:hypothetical protein